MITTFNAVVNTTMPPSCHSVTARDQPFYQMQNKALAVFWVTVTGTAGASTYTEWQLSALVITTLWLAEAWPWQKFLRHFLPWIEFFKTSNFKSTRVQICLISEGKSGFIFNFFFCFRQRCMREGGSQERGGHWRMAVMNVAGETARGQAGTSEQHWEKFGERCPTRPVSSSGILRKWT